VPLIKASHHRQNRETAILAGIKGGVPELPAETILNLHHSRKV
jgi:hypothetical protein